MSFKRIVVGVDGSRAAEAAADIAADIAKRYTAELLLVSVVPSDPGRKVRDALAEYQEAEHVHMTDGEALQSMGRIVVERIESRLRAGGLKHLEPIVLIGDPAPTLAALATERAADLIVVGRRGLSDLAALLLGSVSHKVIQLAPCPCLTVA